jgi:hypothetical protein
MAHIQKFTKRFSLILKINYASVQRSVKGTIKAKDLLKATRHAVDQVSYWLADDCSDHGKPLKASISIRELKPKTKKP